ncbi:MAG: Vms1/Ankzf1 family peptidyl-tRNA hydrolase [bacterium]|nr:Vms1/Ankzf1 family peptidyl-tRNA hydrolase [bacterium]
MDLDNSNLKELVKLTAPDRAFLSIYISGKSSLKNLDSRIKTLKDLIGANKDEQEYFSNNVQMVNDYFKKNPNISGNVCIFACWVLDYFNAIPIKQNIQELIKIDSSPYIKPLAELLDEYENYLAVVADNTSARIYLVTAERNEEEIVIKGNVKNHVRKGGWSQQRYERRRDKELLLYAKEIGDKIVELNEKKEFRRIILVGSKETLNEILKVVPDYIKEQIVGEKSIDLSKGDAFIEKEIYDLFVQEERHSERELWDKIKKRYLSCGLSVIGVNEVMEAVKAGKMEILLILKDLKLRGYRCKKCDALLSDDLNLCPVCKGELFEIDLVEEIIELVKLGNGEVDFAEKIKELSQFGGLAGLIRY